MNLGDDYMKEYGFVRVGAFVNKLVLANPKENAKEIVKGIKDAYKKGVAIFSTVELALTGYSCGDLFLQDKLIKDAEDSLATILEETKKEDIISIIGMPIKIDNGLFDVAVVIQKGHILGVVPKNNVCNYNGYNEARWFRNANDLVVDKIFLVGQEIIISKFLVFKDIDNRNISFGIVFGNDLNDFDSVSSTLILNSANVIFNLASSNEIVGKCERRIRMVYEVVV